MAVQPMATQNGSDGQDTDHLNDSDAEYETSKEYNSLQSLFGLFCEQLNPNGIVAHAFAKGIIRQNEFDDVEAAKTQLDKNKIFLSAVIKCGPKRIKGFCELLLRNGERRIGLKLLNEFKHQGVDVTTLDLPPVSPPVINHERPQYCPVSKKLRKPFTSLKRTIRRVSKKMDDFNFTCQEVLQEFLRARGKEGLVKRESFKNCSNDAALDLLLDYTDPIDCELLDDLVEQMEDNGLDQEWEDYKRLLKEEVLKTLDQCEKGECRPLREGQIALGFQTKQQASQHTMDKILGMKGFLTDVVGLRDADFLGVGNSTVTLFFGVARTHLPFLVLWLSRYCSNLRAFSVSVVFVPGEFMYDVDMDQEFSYPKIHGLKDRIQQSVEKSVERTNKEPHHDPHLEQRQSRMSAASFVSNESGFGEGVPRTPVETHANLKELVEKTPPPTTLEVELLPVPRAEWQTSKSEQKLQEICKRTREYMDACEDDRNGKHHYQQYKLLNILSKERDELPSVDKHRRNPSKAVYSPLTTSQTSLSAACVQPSPQGGKYVQKTTKKVPHQVTCLPGFLNRSKTNH